MDKIWYRNPSKSEVIGRCGRDKKKRMTTLHRQKSNAKTKQKKQQWYDCLVVHTGLIIVSTPSCVVTLSVILLIWLYNSHLKAIHYRVYTSVVYTSLLVYKRMS